MESQKVIDHYGNRSIDERVGRALELANLDGNLVWSDLAALDQFHVGGLTATRDLAEALVRATGGGKLGEVLDVGCGLGGPSRFLGATYDCRVTGIDLTPTFVEVAEKLTQRCGLANSVTFRAANALDLPFADAAFDNAWTQHVAMNIADRPGLYASIHRVLKPGGLLAIYDIVLGSGEALIFPVPWASRPEISFLLNGDDMRRVLADSGFSEVSWADKTEAYAQLLPEQAPTPQQSPTPPALGLHVVMGREFGDAVANLRQNIAEGRARLVQAILRKV